MLKLLAYIFERLGNTNVFIRALFPGLALLLAFVLGTVDLIKNAWGTFDALVMPSLNSAGLSMSPFALANYFLPLSEAGVMFLAWLAFHLACTAVRLVKSWIPTLS